ncbi:MAG: serine/threonine protein kinase [Kiritimatiellae bacterium]|nr:serine/threonine protein kinase [Kiritimatiellia bacterium]
MECDFDRWLDGRKEDESADDGELRPGTAIGDWSVVARLGRGGFADVYKARSASGGFAAVKMLHRLDGKSRARFARESGILSSVKHRNIPRMLGSGNFGERPYIVLELLQSRELPSGDRRVASFLRQIASAAGELHAKGYVHRDIKPANILFRGDGTPVLVDFGLACPISECRREEDGLSLDGGRRVAVGTVGYAAPEQFSGLSAGPEADVHAIGALIADCFPGKMPGCWRSIHLMATASNPKSRYRSASGLGKAIRARHWRGAALAAAGLAAACAIAYAAAGRAGDAASAPPPSPPSATERQAGVSDGFRFSAPFSMDMMPVNAPDADAKYTVSLQIVYTDGSAGRPETEETLAAAAKAGERLNGWLEEYVASEHRGKEFEDLVDELRQKEVEEDINEYFPAFVEDKMDAIDPQKAFRVDSMTVAVEPEGILKDAASRPDPLSEN